MTLQRIVGIVLALTGIGAVLGAVIGGILGTASPSLFRALFSDSNIDPQQVGFGLGVANGLTFGFILGIVTVLCLTFGKRSS